jgi:hypothetical protein
MELLVFLCSFLEYTNDKLRAVEEPNNTTEVLVLFALVICNIVVVGS